MASRLNVPMDQVPSISPLTLDADLPAHGANDKNSPICKLTLIASEKR
jgi:hypothetical protein